jgi:subtilisin family serine protease
VSKFVAVRKRPRPDPAYDDIPVEERRLSAIEQGEDTEKTERLAMLGLSYVHPEDFTPEAENAFHHLPFVDAFIVEAADRQLAEQARLVLEEDYTIAPDVALAIPVPTNWQPTVRESDPARRWPEASGVQIARNHGITGQGVIVGVLDTGCDADHIEFRSKKVDFRYVPLNSVTDAVRAVRGFDVDGHGTHVCGIIAGENIGVAPDVELLVASVLESETLKTSLDRVLIGLDWMLSHFSEAENLAKPTIVNMSLGFPPEALRLPAYKRAAELFRKVLRIMAEDFGVLTVVAIGNDGPGKMRAPGFYPECLAVGALDFELAAADFSGGGVSPISGRPKPDIAGYGVDIVSAFERTMANRSRYVRMSGTSMASPYVAGIAALYASARPEMQGNDLRQRLIASALPVKGAPERVGAGLARYVQYGG